MEEISKRRLTPSKVPRSTITGKQEQIAPGKIWDALTTQQQQQLYQRLVSICCHLSNGGRAEQQEVKYEQH